MGRSLGVVVVGWASGFLIAIAWSAARANNLRLATTLSGWAIAGMVVTALLLVWIALTNRADRRRAARESDREMAVVSPVAEAAATERRTAARIGRIEARLAREQEELDAAVASLAAAELAATGHVHAGPVDAVPDAEAAKLEPILRQEVLETVADLVGRDPAQTAVLAGQLEALLEKAR
ncbi:MAG: hypothetical protein JF886_16605 [Candidatus Dormibacteraeota bacterium]|uniref:Uncharacterized protein n=1 Tax=Candidatus Aeolococcus gillhamiae TaxID=3127015 RepID=A0A934N7F6_9BACT|nr:hypothetical protein [Candidatus Dormibacteraeota bacterium]